MSDFIVYKLSIAAWNCLKGFLKWHDIDNTTLIVYIYLAELNMLSYWSRHRIIPAEMEDIANDVEISENDVSEDIDQNSEDGSGDDITDHCEIGNSGNESDDDGEYHFASSSDFGELEVEEAKWLLGLQGML